jgi:hypothetical protein
MNFFSSIYYLAETHLAVKLLPAFFALMAVVAVSVIGKFC